MAQLSLKTLCLKVAREATIEVLTRVGVLSASSPGEGPICKLTYVDVGRIHALQGSESLGSSLTAAWDSAQLPDTWASPTWSLDWKASKRDV